MLRRIIFVLVLVGFPVLIGAGTAWYQQHSVPLTNTSIPQAQSNQQNNAASLLRF